MNTRRRLTSYASLSFFTALALLPSCSDDSTQTSTSSGSTSSSSGDVSSSSSGSATGGMGGSGGSATGGMGGMGGDGGSATGGSGGSAPCTPGATTFCYTGTPGTEIVGACKAGLKTCQANGTYGPCVGEVVPSPESCSTMVDDDCDGSVNEDCACTPNSTAPCYTGSMDTLNVGDCKAGVQTCNGQGTAYGPCIGQVLPQTENCTLPGDEDCDGQTNESGAGCTCVPNTTASCYTGPMGTQNVGDCKGGIWTCNGQGTAYGPCIGEVVPQTETCALPGDEDCDGQANESGAMCVCVPNTTANCYTGPMGTQNVGECVGGTWTCNAQGTAYGACMGQVVPAAAENCMTPGDDDCDGLANENCTTSYTKTISGVLDEDIHDVAVDPQGNIVVVGAFSGMVDFGGGPVTTPNGNSDIFVAKYNAQGVHIWSKQFGGTGIDRAQSVAVSSGGTILVTGVFQGTADFGGGPLMSVGGSHDIFLLALTSDGGYLISQAFGGTGGDEGNGVAFDGNGNAIVAGRMTGTIDFGGGPLTSAGGDDAFIAKFSSFGQHLWSRHFGDASAQYCKDVAVDASGNIYFTGTFAGTTDFGGGPATSSGNDGMLVKYSSAGNHLWTRIWTGTGNQNGNGVTVDAQGRVIVVGHAVGTVDFGLGAVITAGGGDAFVAKYDANNVPQWAKVFGDGVNQTAWSVDTDTQNNVVMVGTISGTADFGGGVLTSAGGNDAFVAKFSSAGAHVWSRRAGDAFEQTARSVAIDGSNNSYVVGRFQGNVDFGTGTVTSGGGYDGFIVKYGP